MDWHIVQQWLEDHGHIHIGWECIDVGDDSIYCSDELENTFISIFTKGSGELVFYVGILRPKLSVGGNTGVYIESPYDVIDYLHDNMEDMYEALNRKVMC